MTAPNPLPLTVDAGERTAYSFAQLLDTGMLWLINASVFHPRGLALALDFGEGDEQPTGWSLHASADGEPFMFADDPTIHERFRAAEALMGFARTDGVAPEQPSGAA